MFGGQVLSYLVFSPDRRYCLMNSLIGQTLSRHVINLSQSNAELVVEL